MTKNTEVILYEEKDANAVTLFNGDGLDPFIENIRKVAEEFEADVTTEKGRKAISSLAYKVSNAKSLVERLRLEENESHQAQINKNNAKGKKAKNALQEIQDNVKQPVTDWNARIKGHQDAITAIQQTSLSIQSRWDIIDTVEIDNFRLQLKSDDRDWQEFSFKAEGIKKQAIEAIESTIAKRKKQADDKLEFERLQKAESDRLQKERDDAIALKAAEAARQEAEAEAEQKRIAEAAKAEAARSEAAAVLLKAQQDKDKAESERKAAVIAAEEAKKQAIVDKALAIKQAAEAAEALVKQKALADEQAEAAKQLAIETKAINAAAVIAAEKKAADQREVDRLKVVADLQKQADDQRAADLAVIAKREADEEHKKNVILEAKNALVAVEGLPYRLASGAIEAIVSGEIPHVSFNY